MNNERDEESKRGLDESRIQPSGQFPWALAAGAAPMGFSRWPRMLLLVAMASLMARLALLPWFADISPGTYDEKDFNKLAVNIVQRGEFALEAGTPTSFRPPLYPAFVSAIYAVFGVENFQAVRIAQVLINVLTVVLVYLIALELFDPNTANAAAVLIAIYPSLWGHCYLLLTEILFTFLLCLALLFLVRFLRRDRLAELFVGSVLLGLAALTRSAMYLFPPVFVGLLLCARRLSWSRRLFAALLFLATFCATLAPWAIRNTCLEGTLTLVESNHGRLMRWAYAKKEGDKVVVVPMSLEQPVGETQGQRDQRALGSTLIFILQRPGVLASHMAQNFFQFWGLDRELIAGAAAGNLGVVPKGVLVLFASVICGCYVVIFFTGILGAVMFPARDWLGGALLVLTVAHVCMVHSVVFGHSRYHIGIMPVVAIYAGQLLANLNQVTNRELRTRLWIAGALCGTFLCAWVIQLAHDQSLAMLGGASGR